MTHHLNIHTHTIGPSRAPWNPEWHVLLVTHLDTSRNILSRFGVQSGHLKFLDHGWIPFLFSRCFSRQPWQNPCLGQAMIPKPWVKCLCLTTGRIPISTTAAVEPRRCWWRKNRGAVGRCHGPCVGRCTIVYDVCIHRYCIYVSRMCNYVYTYISHHITIYLHTCICMYACMHVCMDVCMSVCNVM